MRKEFWETGIYLIRFFIDVTALSKGEIKRQIFEMDLFIFIRLHFDNFFYSECLVVFIWGGVV